MRDGLVRVLESIVDETVIQRFYIRMDPCSMADLMGLLKYCSESTRKRWINSIIQEMESASDQGLIRDYYLKLDHESMFEIMELLEQCTDSTRQRWIEAYRMTVV